MNNLGMGYPVRDTLLEFLKENLTPSDAEIALALPTGVAPFSPVGIDTILNKVTLSRDELKAVLERLARKGFLYVGKTSDGQDGYALHKVGFGFPQTFFWKGEDTPHARKMALLVAKYFNRKIIFQAYGSHTKPYRYIPVGTAVKPNLQGVYPAEMMEQVIAKARRVAVAHCPCRVGYRLVGRGCEHPTEVRMKFDELADYVIDRGLAREITRDEALDVLRLTEKAGLVHFVDNAEGDIKHNCNCCGCACLNVGNIRRRKIQRDTIMATYFMRETDFDECTGCGECAAICPVEAVHMSDDLPVVDREWCIGCGVCATVCPSAAAVVDIRDDKRGELPFPSFAKLHDHILNEKRS